MFIKAGDGETKERIKVKEVARELRQGCCQLNGKSEKRGALETGAGRSPGQAAAALCSAGSKSGGAPSSLGEREQRYKAWVCSSEFHGSFVLRFFIFFWQAGIPGQVSENGLNRIFISFPGVSFNMLIHQNMHIEGSGLFSGWFYFQRMLSKRDWTKASLPWDSLGCVNHLLLSVLD